MPLPFLIAPLLVLMGLGAVLTSFDNVPAEGTVRDVLATRAISGLSDEPQSADTPPPPASADTPLQEIGVHPPGSTADAASKHLRGLTSGLEEMLTRPLGRGLGATGNWSRTPGSTSESTVGVIAAQLGIAGFALYSGFFAYGRCLESARHLVRHSPGARRGDAGLVHRLVRLGIRRWHPRQRLLSSLRRLGALHYERCL